MNGFGGQVVSICYFILNILYDDGIIYIYIYDDGIFTKVEILQDYF